MLPITETLDLGCERKKNVTHHQEGERMNYGEELAYWYLRLNGFFPLPNFVVHKSSQVQYSSDCDLIAIRHPYVYEEIGGKADDWDDFLCNQLDFNRTLGLICEVKTGRYDRKELFEIEKLRYAIGRLGLVPVERVDGITKQLKNSSTVEINDTLQISKLLVANIEKNADNHLFLTLQDVRRFLRSRVRKYPIEKFSDRMFFGSILFQELIDQIALNDDQGFKRKAGAPRSRYR